MSVLGEILPLTMELTDCKRVRMQVLEHKQRRLLPSNGTICHIGRESSASSEVRLDIWAESKEYEPSLPVHGTRPYLATVKRRGCESVSVHGAAFIDSSTRYILLFYFVWCPVFWLLWASISRISYLLLNVNCYVSIAFNSSMLALWNQQIWDITAILSKTSIWLAFA